jgi:hypothetical protein
MPERKKKIMDTGKKVGPEVNRKLSTWCRIHGKNTTKV